MDKQHIIYKITNQLNNRFYVGMHTGFPDDSYFGSGKRLKAEIKKYGKENFKKEILEILTDRKLLELREAELVNEELLANPLCLNLKNGGEGGGKIWNEEHLVKLLDAARQTTLKRSFAEKSAIAKRAMATQKRKGLIFFGGSNNKLGTVQTVESRNKIAASMVGKQNGEKNSQFGTCWVTNGKPIKIKKEQLDEYLANGYSRGRKISL